LKILPITNNETIIKIPKKNLKKHEIGFESIFENQTFQDQIEVIPKKKNPN
jgi:hypothetical protein